MANIVTARDYGAIRGLPRGVRNHLRSVYAPGTGNSAYLLRQSPDLVIVEDQFTQAIQTALWTATADSGATAFAYTAAANGRLVGTCDNTSGQAVSLYGAKVHWYGDKFCGMCCIFKVDIVTDLQFEIGFANAVSDKTLPVITDIDTPASGNGGTDLAVVHMDTSQTLTTMAFATDGSTSGYNCTKTNLGTQTPTAATYMGVKVWFTGTDAVACEVFDATPGGAYPVLQRASHGSTTASKVEGGTALAPWVFFATKASEAKVVNLDYLAVWQDR